MKSSVLVVCRGWCVGILLLQGFCMAAPQGFDALRSQMEYSVGMTWIVQDWYSFVTDGGRTVIPRNKAVDVRFTVIGETETREIPCYVVEAVWPPSQMGSIMKYAAHISKDTHNIVGMENTSVRDDGSPVSSTLRDIDEHKLHWDYRSSCGFFAHFPNFELGDWAEQEIELGVTTITRQEILPGEDPGEWIVRLSLSSERGDRKRTFEVTQTWQEGMPWWSKYVEKEDGEIKWDNSLKSVNGVPVGRFAEEAAQTEGESPMEGASLADTADTPAPLEPFQVADKPRVDQTLPPVQQPIIDVAPPTKDPKATPSAAARQDQAPRTGKGAPPPAAQPQAFTTQTYILLALAAILLLIGAAQYLRRRRK